MRDLLDVNILIALVDPAHVDHDAAHLALVSPDPARKRP
jgi:hypothetical protein